jgi:hypothetical protein
MNRSRLTWTALTFGPAVFGLVVAASYFAQGQAGDGFTILVFAGAFASCGIATLHSYRAGYWRGRVDEREEDVARHALKHLSGWQPNPWDDGRWSIGYMPGAKPKSHD